MKPAVAAHAPLSLIGETLSLLAWHIPDLVVYQHNQDEWWFAPLDDNLPIVRLNRTGPEILQAMSGHTTVGTLVKNMGQRPADRTDNRDNGIWNIGLCPPTPSVTTVSSHPAAIATKPSGIYSSSKSGKAGRDRMDSRGKSILKTFITTN